MASVTTHKSKGDKAGESPKILCEMLQYLGHQECPLYQGFKEEVNGREEWRVEVLIDTQKHKPLIFEAYGIRSTFYAGIRDAACQAMYRLRDMYADDLSNTPYHYFPRRRICNTEKEIHYYKKHHHQNDLVLIQQQQIRFTKALVAVCDDALDELREARCRVRELEEELRKAPRHNHKAIAASSPPPHRRVIVGDKKPYQSPGHKAVTAPAPAPAALKRIGIVVGNTNRRACLSLQRKPAPTRSNRGAAPAPCDRRRLARGVVNEDSVSSFGGGSSAYQLPQGQGDGYRPPIASTQKSFLMHQVPVAVEGHRRNGASGSSSSFEGRMHGSNLMAVAVGVEGLRRDGAPASSSSFERRMHGSNLMAIIIDGGVALGKEPANANNSDDATTSTSAPCLFWENMEKPCSCSSARRRRLL